MYKAQIMQSINFNFKIEMQLIHKTIPGIVTVMAKMANITYSGEAQAFPARYELAELSSRKKKT